MDGTRTRDRHAARRLGRRRWAVKAAMAPADGLARFVRTHRWWQTLLLVIGLVSVGTAVGVLFLGVDRGPRTVTTSGPVAPVDSRDFALAVGRLVVDITPDYATLTRRRWPPPTRRVVLPRGAPRSAVSVDERLHWFDAATARQRERERRARRTPPAGASDRGWARDDLYDRGRPR